jgi:single-stranded-DNA-specific exonuclease
MSSRLPNQRWLLHQPEQKTVALLVKTTGVSPLIAQILINRGINTPELAQIYINPESAQLPPPLAEFPDLEISIALLENAIENEEKIGICGDYDADGMTSTALLLRAFKHLGANAEYAIPSRMKDGYGINQRIVEEFAENGFALILTVDNGISAYEPINLARELGLDVIITDHHDLPDQLPPANAILNPKLLHPKSPYRGLAGVGVAYILAITLAQKLNRLSGLTSQLLELFTLGTIADLAPLVGVNRRWLKRGLKQLPKSNLVGIQSLIQISGVKEEQKQLNPDDIGFRLGPRINAVGRIADPQTVIELLTTDEEGIALERAMQCEQINQQRQQLCEQIEFEAISLIEQTPINWQEDRVLVIVQSGWHHGVIGIVASRLVDRYGVPVFIGTYEEETLDKIRGSARGIEEFNIFEALNFCQDLLGKYGGHKAAGGFSFPSQNLESFKTRLSEFAHQCLETDHLKPLIKVDCQADFPQLTSEFYQKLEQLQPWGIENNTPIFWTPNVRILEQEKVGKNHLKVTVGQNLAGQIHTFKAIAWRWSEYLPLPSLLDIAYKLKENNWNGETNIELEIVGVRLGNIQNKQVSFTYDQRVYHCQLLESVNQLQITNDKGQILSVNKGQRVGLLQVNSQETKQVDVTRSNLFNLIKTALAAWEATQ